MKAERELSQLEDITRGVEEVPYAAAAARKAREQTGELIGKLKAIDKQQREAANLASSYGDDLDDCRGVRRTSGLNVGAGPVRAPIRAADCSNQERTLARVRGAAAAYKLLIRLTVPDLAASARELDTAAGKLQRADAGSARLKVAVAVGNLKRAGAAARRAAARAALIKRARKRTQAPSRRRRPLWRNARQRAASCYHSASAHAWCADSS